MSKFDEIVVVLMFTRFGSDLPTLGRLKKLLGTSDVHLYKSGGYYSEDVEILRDAINYSSSSLLPIGHGGPYGTPCSDLLVTRVGAARGDFLRLVHPGLVIDAFELTKVNFMDLELLLNKMKAAKAVHLSYKSWCSSVQRNIEKFNELGINDPSVIDIDVDALNKQSDSYAIQTLVNTHNQITQWVVNNRWSD